jgi:CRP-like cAMP-binding protein
MMMKIPEGTVIIREGEVSMDMYKIISGHVELYTGYRTKKETILGIQSKDSFIGEVGLLAQKPAIYTAVAFSDVVVLRITMAEIDLYMQENHRDAMAIMTKMAQSMYSLKYSMDSFVDDLIKGAAVPSSYKGFFSKSFSKYNVDGEASHNYKSLH